MGGRRRLVGGPPWGYKTTKPLLNTSISLPAHSSTALHPHTYRYDAGNASIAADLDELRAAMQPDLDAPALRLRGNARFQAQDYEGAVEAFTLLLGMPEALTAGTGEGGGLRP